MIAAIDDSELYRNADGDTSILSEDVNGNVSSQQRPLMPALYLSQRSRSMDLLFVTDKVERLYFYICWCESFIGSS